MSNTFLSRDELRELTGRTHVNLQIAALSKMGIPFYVNGVGRPVVARSAIEGRAGSPAPARKRPWVPKVLDSD